MSMTRMRAATPAGLALVGAAAVLWGTAGVASTFLFDIADSHPLAVGFYRLAIAAPVLLGLALVLLGPAGLRVRRADWGFLILLGLMQAGYQGLYFGAVSRAGVTLATLIALCSAPVLVTLLAVLFEGERLTRRVLLAVGLAMLGTGLLVGFPGAIAAEGATLLTGLAMAAGAALCYAVFAWASRRLTGGYHPFTLIGLGFGMGALVLAPLAVPVGLAVPADPAAWAVLLYLGLGTTSLAYALFLLGLRRVTMTASSVLVLIEPLTAAVLAWALFGERLGPLGAVGAALLLGAVALLSLREGRKPARGGGGLPPGRGG